MSAIPIIDVSSLVNNKEDKVKIAKEIGKACRHYGFFYAVNHGVDENLQKKIETFGRQFFALPLEIKQKISIDLGGSAVRGYFRCGNEPLSERPDVREGMYFGEELDSSHPYVKARVPYFGANLFPDDEIPEMRSTVLEYISQITSLAHKIMEAISISLGLDENYFYDRYTKHASRFLTIQNYPPITQDLQDDNEVWGIAEHIDHGLITIIKQDNCGGLQVKTQSGWVEALPVDKSFVCNIGRMLQIITGGFYKAPVHRVKAQTKVNRLSYPFFFDPDYFAQIKKIENLPAASEDKSEHWNKNSVYEFSGTYGEYLHNEESQHYLSKYYVTLDSKLSLNET